MRFASTSKTVYHIDSSGVAWLWFLLLLCVKSHFRLCTLSHKYIYIQTHANPLKRVSVVHLKTKLIWIHTHTQHNTHSTRLAAKFAPRNSASNTMKKKHQVLHRNRHVSIPPMVGGPRTSHRRPSCVYTRNGGGSIRLRYIGLGETCVICERELLIFRLIGHQRVIFRHTKKLECKWNGNWADERWIAIFTYTHYVYR